MQREREKEKNQIGRRNNDFHHEIYLIELNWALLRHEVAKAENDNTTESSRTSNNYALKCVEKINELELSNAWEAHHSNRNKSESDDTVKLGKKKKHWERVERWKDG